MNQLKTFISYSSEDKLIGKLFKRCFENYAGFSVFLAHEDIAPATEWELKIAKNLKEVDLVFPLITDNYRNSEFTDQELGMALAWNKIIIPIKLSNINPYGFIKKLQALKCRCEENEIINAVVTVVFVLVKNKQFNKFKDKVVDSVVSAFCKSASYSATRIITRMLLEIDYFDRIQIDHLKDAIRYNNQVCEELYALPALIKKLKDEYKIVIDT